VLITFQRDDVTQRLVGTYSDWSKTKSIRPRLRPRARPVWDRLVIRPRSQTPRLVTDSQYDQPRILRDRQPEPHPLIAG